MDAGEEQGVEERPLHHGGTPSDAGTPTEYSYRHHMAANHHEVGHALSACDPTLVGTALRRAGLDTPGLVRVEPLKHPKHQAIRIQTTSGEEQLLVLEVLHRRNPAKPAAWSKYQLELVERYKLPVTIVVIATNTACERWAMQYSDLGPATGDPDTPSIRPLVLGPSTIPPITDITQAKENPVYAALSILVHRDGHKIGAILKATADALADSPDPERTALVDYITSALEDTQAADLWKDLKPPQRYR